MQTVQKTTSSSLTAENLALEGKWVLYYHLPQDKNWEFDSFKIIMSDIDRADKLIALNESLPTKVVQYTMLFVMRKGIKPMWEDPQNKNGGCFSYKVSNKFVTDVWKSLFYALCGETLFIDPKKNKFANGITISPKKNFCIVKIWMRDESIQDPSDVIHIPNLTTFGCLFKKHGNDA